MKGMGEFAFIERIQEKFPESEKIPLGIGDDTAAIRIAPEKLTLLTTDTLVEETHFKRAYSSFFQIGNKAISVNLSDIAAMGGKPRFFLVSLGLPPDIQIKDLDELYRGIARVSHEADICLVGGNTTATAAHFFISITLVGEVCPKKMIRRSGANEGDFLYVTGTLGDASAGLDLLKSGDVPDTFSHLVRRHQCPEARTKEGQLLTELGLASSMIDISDGLTGDLQHIMNQSHVGALIQLERIPISPALKHYASRTVTHSLDYALYGGDDYELLFSAPEDKVAALEALVQKGEIQATRIGRLVPEKEGLVVQGHKGSLSKISPKGYDHLRLT